MMLLLPVVSSCGKQAGGNQLNNNRQTPGTSCLFVCLLVVCYFRVVCGTVELETKQKLRSHLSPVIVP